MRASRSSSIALPVEHRLESLLKLRPTVASFGASATPSRADSRAAAPANWSVEKGSTSSGTPAPSASVTELLPPWVTAAVAESSIRTCGRWDRTSQSSGSGPSAAGGVEPVAIAARTPAERSASETLRSTSSRTERKLPKLT